MHKSCCRGEKQGKQNTVIQQIRKKATFFKHRIYKNSQGFIFGRPLEQRGKGERTSSIRSSTCNGDGRSQSCPIPSLLKSIQPSVPTRTQWTDVCRKTFSKSPQIFVTTHLQVLFSPVTTLTSQQVLK